MLWKEVGRRKGCVILAGQTQRSVKDATKKKARRSTDRTIARVGGKSETRFQRNQGQQDKLFSHRGWTVTRKEKGRGERKRRKKERERQALLKLSWLV